MKRGIALVFLLFPFVINAGQLRFSTKEVGGWVLGYDSYYEAYFFTTNKKKWLATYADSQKVFYMYGDFITNDKVWIGFSAARGHDLPTMAGYKSMIGIQQFDCKKRLTRIIQIHAFKDYWGIGQRKILNNSIDWEKPQTNSFAKNVLDIACRRLELRKIK